MRRLLVFWAIFALLLCSVSGACAASGQSYDAFIEAYSENLTFINENTGRYLLPLVITRSGANEGGGHRVYQLYGDVLSAVIRMDATNSAIESCQIMLTAPADMSYGSAVHNDFTISGYHSYALLMAMSTAAEPYERYSLVEEVNAGLAASADGLFTSQVGAYRLTCTRADSSVTMLFENADVVAAREAAEAAAQEEAESGEADGEDVLEDEPDDADEDSNEEDASLAG